MFKFKIPAMTQALFTTHLDVRINNINYGNHLGHDALISLLHEARMRFLHSLGFNEGNINGLGILVTQLAVNYLNQAFYGDDLTIHLEMGDKTQTSLQLIYHVYSQAKNIEIARAITTITFFDYQQQKITRIPQAFLSQLTIN